MPNGGFDNCGVCGFNRANEGVWGEKIASQMSG
jgi:hypothetical protein